MYGCTLVLPFWKGKGVSVISGSVFSIGTLRIVPHLLVKAMINLTYVFACVYFKLTQSVLDLVSGGSLKICTCL